MLHYTFKIVILLLMLISPMTLLAQIQARDSVRKDTVKQEEKKTVKYTLKGIVIGDSDDDSLPGAHIYLGSEKKPVTVTNAMGEFTLKDLAPGEVIVTASYVGFRPTTKKYLVM